MNNIINGLNLIQVNTTAWEEEDFLLVTTLTDEQIKSAIEPLVLAERNDGNIYDNEELVKELRKQFPHNLILHYTTDAIETLSI
jgi:hypothetical protein